MTLGSVSLRDAPALLGLPLSIAVVAACGGDDTRPVGHLPPATTTTTTTGSTSSGGGTGGAGGGTGGHGGEVTVGGGDLGNLPVEPIADTPCDAVGGTKTTLYAAGPSSPQFDRVAKVGARRAAGGSVAEGFVTFDMDGASPSPAVVQVAANYNLFASEGSTIGLVGSKGLDLFYQRYSAQDATVGAKLTVASGVQLENVAIGGGGSEAFIVWGSANSVRGRGVDASGAFAGDAFDVATDGYGSSLYPSVAQTTGGFAVAWTGDPEVGTYRTRFARVSLTDVTLPAVDITASFTVSQVVKLVRMPDGYALLVTGSGPKFTPYIIVLDDDGHPTQPAAMLEGAYFGWDLAVNGTNLAVTAARVTGEPEVRELDGTLKPLGNWLCLDGPTSTGEVSGIDADGAGWAVVFRDSSGAEALVRF